MKSRASESKPFQSRSKGEIPGWARQKERLSRFKLKWAFLTDSDAKLFMYLVRLMKGAASEPGLRSGKLQSLPEKIILCNLSISHGWIKNL